MNEKIRIAIIGFGKIARDQHMPAILADGRYELVAAVSTQPLSLPHEKCFTDYREMLKADLKLDAVTISTPPSVRTAIARDCLAARLHLFLEKPPATTLGEADEIVRLAAEAKRTLFTSWHAQANAAVVAAAARLKGKRIAAMEIVWHENVRKWHPGQGWVWDAGGFGVFDPGINALSIAVEIFPGALFVDSAALSFPANKDNPIAARLGLSSPAADGPLNADFDWRTTEGETWTIEVRTTDGETVKLVEGGGALEVNGQRQDTGPAAEYPTLYDRFAKLVQSGDSHVDIRPLRLVADAFLRAKRVTVGAFQE